MIALLSRTLLLVLILSSSAVARDGSQEADIRSLIASTFPADGPGGAVAISQDGQPAFIVTGGLSSLADDQPIGDRTPFYIASLAKPFTAIAVLTLAERGDLNLDDPVTQYIPDLPSAYATVKIRHLLNHQGGVPDFFKLLDDDVPPAFMNGDVRVLLKAHPNLDHEPGTAVSYSNTGYLLLAEVVQTADGRSMASWLAEEIFHPLKMRDAYVLEPGTRQKTLAARGYRIDDDNEVLDDDYDLRTVGAGGIYASISDLVRFDAELRSPAVLSKTVVDAMATPDVLVDGELTPFSAGWIAGTIERPGPLDGLNVQQVFGDNAGFRAAMRRFENGTTIIWLTNYGRHLFNLNLAELWLSD